ncbi:MAG: NADH-quinone oxidoreductase subunit C [Proteobacteria bacterium]|nr:NADH-quinone oxidoreductase subunit C [Pseudomonadota bacterium]
MNDQNELDREVQEQFDPARRFLLELADRGVEAQAISPSPLPPAHLLEIAKPYDWGKAAAVAQSQAWRWAAGWAEDGQALLSVSVCLELQGIYMVLRTRTDARQPCLPSHAAYFFAANRPERHMRDLFGIEFTDHPDPRRWTRHQAWDSETAPLRKSFPKEGLPPGQTPPDMDYPFFRAEGHGVYEIPVGPVHAGIIEPGHFRFHAVGETLLHLEERLGYVHKGVEKIAEGRTPESLARLAGRVSGDTTVGHAFAACLAMERAANLEAPPRAAFIRGILAERERIANHLWDMAAICNDVGFGFAYYQLGRLREVWLRDNQAMFGHRLLMDRIIPGGVSVDVPNGAGKRMRASNKVLRLELDDLLTIIDANSSLEDRIVTTGYLTLEDAQTLGALGFVGRASGQVFDVRHDAPYSPYDQVEVKVPLEEQGDVASRFWVRYKEMRVALKLIESLLDKMPDGDIAAPWITPKPGAEGLGLVEGWRGEILSFVRFGENGCISRYYPRDPSIVNWPALEKIALGNIVPDFPVCNKSVNGSYSGNDL